MGQTADLPPLQRILAPFPGQLKFNQLCSAPETPCCWACRGLWVSSSHGHTLERALTWPVACSPCRCVHSPLSGPPPPPLPQQVPAMCPPAHMHHPTPSSPTTLCWAPSCPGSAPFRAKVTDIAADTRLCAASPLLSPAPLQGSPVAPYILMLGSFSKPWGTQGSRTHRAHLLSCRGKMSPEGQARLLPIWDCSPSPTSPHSKSWRPGVSLLISLPASLGHRATSPECPAHTGAEGSSVGACSGCPAPPTHWCPSCLSTLTRPLCHLLRTPCSWSAGLK